MSSRLLNQKILKVKQRYKRSLAGDAAGNPGDGGKPLETAGDSSVALHKKHLLPEAIRTTACFRLAALILCSANITYYMSTDDEPGKKLDDVLDVGSCNNKNYLS